MDLIPLLWKNKENPGSFPSLQQITFRINVSLMALNKMYSAGILKMPFKNSR
jgi:hypothetical protein